MNSLRSGVKKKLFCETLCKWALIYLYRSGFLNLFRVIDPFTILMLTILDIPVKNSHRPISLEKIIVFRI